MQPPLLRHSLDSHFHYWSTRQRLSDLDDRLDELYRQGFAGLIDVGIDLQNWAERLEAADRRLKAGQAWFLAEGLHPNAAAEQTLDLTVLADRLRHPAVVAVGEIGLDWFRGRQFEIRQREVFAAQLDLARQADLPVIIHCRNADADVLAALQSAALPRAGVMHCFSSDYDYAVKCLDLGYLISFAGNLTYPKATNLHEAARRLPLDRLLYETDSPYLAPQPVRGQVNHPGYLAHTAQFLAELRQVPVETVVETVRSTFAEFFRITWL